MFKGISFLATLGLVVLVVWTIRDKWTLIYALTMPVFFFLSNAIRYTPSGGDVEVALEAVEDAIKISVRDNGIGIPLEKQSRVFEKFFRADNALAKVPEGTGLGLNLVKELVGLWGGRVWFESPTLWRKGGRTEHAGSCFYFTIPYKGMSPRLEGKSLV